MTPGYKQSEVGKIPEDWDVIPLSGLCRSICDGTHFTPKYVPEGIPFYSVENVTADDFTNTKYISQAEHAQLIKRCKPERGDILMTRITAGVLGDTKLLDWDVNASIYVSLALLKPNGRVVSEYLYRYSRSPRFVQDVERMGLVNATPKKINMGDIGAIPIPVPKSEAEQRAIAAALSDVDALLDGLNRLIAKKRDLKRAAMQQLLTGQTRLRGFRGEWEVKRLGEIAALNRVNVVPALQPTKPFTHFSLPAFDAGMNAQIELGSSIGSNKFAVPASSVLVSKLNPRIPRIWAPPSVPENAVDSTEWLVLTPRDGVGRQYLFTLCSSPGFCEQMELAATGTTGSHQRISPSTALDIRIDFAIDPHEQTAIATVLSDMDAELSALEARRDKTRALKQGMMQELLTGRTRLV
ncbi:MAG: restriction endonuclease subunit S [Steroidobacteraceae bacterium]